MRCIAVPQPALGAFMGGTARGAQEIALEFIKAPGASRGIVTLRKALRGHATTAWTPGGMADVGGIQTRSPRARARGFYFPNARMAVVFGPDCAGHKSPQAQAGGL